MGDYTSGPGMGQGGYGPQAAPMSPFGASPQFGPNGFQGSPQPGSVTAAVRAGHQGSPMFMDLLRQSAGLPPSRIGTSSSQGAPPSQFPAGANLLQGMNTGGFMGDYGNGRGSWVTGEAQWPGMQQFAGQLQAMQGPPQMSPNQRLAAQYGMGSRAFYSPANSPYSGYRQQNGPQMPPQQQMGGGIPK